MSPNSMLLLNTKHLQPQIHNIEGHEVCVNQHTVAAAILLDAQFPKRNKYGLKWQNMWKKTSYPTFDNYLHLHHKMWVVMHIFLYNSLKQLCQ